MITARDKNLTSTLCTRIQPAPIHRTSNTPTHFASGKRWLSIKKQALILLASGIGICSAQTTSSAKPSSPSLQRILTLPGVEVPLKDIRVDPPLQKSTIPGNSSFSFQDNALNVIQLNRLRDQYPYLTGRNMTVVVLDTAFDTDHEFFGPDNNHDGTADRIVFQHDFAGNGTGGHDPDVNPMPMPVGGYWSQVNHGTGVASVIASSNATYPGIAPEVKMILLKTWTADGVATTDRMKEALRYVIDRVKGTNDSGLNVDPETRQTRAADPSIVAVNMSFGDMQNWPDYPPDALIFRGELEELVSLGVTPVASAGNYYGFYTNNGSSPIPETPKPGLALPAADPYVIAVGATYDFNGTRAHRAFGATSHTQEPHQITPYTQRLVGNYTYRLGANLTDDRTGKPHQMLMAPGSQLTVANFDKSNPSSRTSITTWDGTSFAAPIVTGLVALAQQYCDLHGIERLTPAELFDLMARGNSLSPDSDLILDGFAGDDQDDVPNTQERFPRVNAYKLITQIAGDAHPPVDSAPIVDAGTDQTLPPSANMTATLSGLVTDDSTNVTLSWTVSSQPTGSSVTFSAPNSASTSAQFSAPGRYELTLTANDGFNAPVTDTVVITVGIQLIANISGGNAINFQWNDLPNETLYHVQISDNAAFRWSAGNSNSLRSILKPANSTSHLQNRMPSGTYYLRVRADMGSNFNLRSRYYFSNVVTVTIP